MKAIDIIDKLPAEFAARLQCDPFFADIAVVVAEKGNVAAEYERLAAIIAETQGKRGICVVVQQLVADDLSANLAFGPMTMKPAFQVVENVELNNDDNGTKKSARKVARKIRDVIKGCNLRGLVMDMRAGKPCIEPIDLKDMGAAVVAYQVNFECLEVSNEDQRQVQEPAFSGTSQLIITCATPGADIYYTTDDSFPFPGDKDKFPGSTAILYSGPVTLTPGQTIVRAAAYLDGQIASSVNRATITTTPL